MAFVGNMLKLILAQYSGLKMIRRILVAVLVTMSVCIALFIAVAALPSDGLRKNIVSATNDGYFDKNYPRYLMFRGIDMFTECVALGAAADMHASVESMLKVNHAGECLNLKAQALENFTRETVPYARYWHGYQVVLKPLYSLFDVATVRVLLVLVNVLLFGILTVVMAQKNGQAYAYATLTSFFLAGTLHVFLLASHAAQFWVVLAGAIAAVLHAGRGAPVALFAVIGVLDAFTSFLNMGSLSLGFPLLCYCLTRWNQDERSDAILAEAFAACVGWSLGLLVMWLGKWAAVLMYEPGFNLLGELPVKYTARGLMMIVEAAGNNLEKTLWRVWLPCFLLLGWRLYDKRVPFVRGLWVVLFPAAIPFVWVALLPGQSGLAHSGFVTIIMWPTIAALFFLLLAMPRQAERVAFTDAFRQVGGYLKAAAAAGAARTRRMRGK